VRVNGCVLHYQQLGTGADLILIHGLLGNLAFWYFSVLPRLIQSFRVCVYDLRGHGQSEMSRQGYRSSDLAEDLRGLLDHLGIERAHLAGHSYGGAVALHFGARYPERVRSLTLADAWVPSLQSPLAGRRSDAWAAARLRLRQAGIARPEALPVVAYALLEDLQRERGSSGTSRSTYSAEQPGFSESAVHRWSELTSRTELPAEVCDVGELTRERIHDVPAPVLAAFGQYSSCLPTFRGLRQNVPQLQAVIIPGVGHLYPLFRPEAFVRNFRPFAMRCVP
jgi:pimeloyl-ACP methyl ester carboxylesterase